jgi:hypothetical protein
VEDSGADEGHQREKRRKVETKETGLMFTLQASAPVLSQTSVLATHSARGDGEIEQRESHEERVERIRTALVREWMEQTARSIVASSH